MFLSLFQGADSCRLSHPVLSADGSCDTEVPGGPHFQGREAHSQATWLLPGAPPGTAGWSSPCHSPCPLPQQWKPRYHHGFWGPLSLGSHEVQPEQAGGEDPAPHPSPRGAPQPPARSAARWDFLGLLEAGLGDPTQLRTTGDCGSGRDGRGGQGQFRRGSPLVECFVSGVCVLGQQCSPSKAPGPKHELQVGCPPPPPASPAGPSRKPSSRRLMLFRNISLPFSWPHGLLGTQGP